MFIVDINDLEIFELKHLPEDVACASFEAFEKIALL
jgi:hypothetical protein